MKFLFFLSFLLFPQTTTCLALNPASEKNSSGKSQTFTSKSYVVSTRKSGGHSRYYFLDNFEKSESSSNTTNEDSLILLPKDATKQSHFIDTIRATFLPLGYPNKTPNGYLKYVIWRCIQDLSTQLRGVLATQRVLEGVGVGREGATALSATINYLIRDGAGMAANLLFTSGFASKFRTDIKRWRLFADVIVDVGITLEVVAVLLPRSFFLPIISLGNMCKAMCGVAAGACGGVINLYWAKGSDLSDVNAKNGAQSTVTGALGLIFSALFARSLDHVKPFILWGVYSSLTFLHIYANVKCLRLVTFDSLSSTRMNILLAEFMNWWESKTQETSPSPPSHKQTSAPTKPKLSSPEIVTRSEPLFFFFGSGSGNKSPKHHVPIHFGVDYNKFCNMSNKSVPNTRFAEEDFNTKKNKSRYLITSGLEKHKRRRKSEPCVLVSLFPDTTPQDEAKAYFHATMLARQLEKNKSNKTRHGDDQDSMGQSSEDKAKSEVDRAWPIFKTACEVVGWDLDKTGLQSCGYEVKYVSSSG